MAADHRYYKRFNFKSDPVEDYEVRDRRVGVPRIHWNHTRVLRQIENPLARLGLLGLVPAAGRPEFNEEFEIWSKQLFTYWVGYRDAVDPHEAVYEVHRREIAWEATVREPHRAPRPLSFCEPGPNHFYGGSCAPKPRNRRGLTDADCVCRRGLVSGMDAAHLEAFSVKVRSSSRLFAEKFALQIENHIADSIPVRKWSH